MEISQIIAGVCLGVYSLVATIILGLFSSMISNLRDERDRLKETQGRPIDINELPPGEYKINESDAYALVWLADVTPGLPGTDKPIAVCQVADVPAKFAVRKPSNDVRIFDLTGDHPVQTRPIPAP
jgi:hypothetical protein